VNDKELVKPLLKKASQLHGLYGRRIIMVIADTQYYSAEVFKTIRHYGAEAVMLYRILQR